MKKTISVNISGFIFNIEEDAYEIMLGYLDTLKSHLKKTEGGDEIYSDIEARIAELFQERLHDAKEVINEEDVKEVISIIGKPEEYLFDEDEEEEKSKSETFDEEYEYAREKRVYRDTDHSIVGGVCSGIANYFGIDPILIRLAFAVLFFGFGTGFLLYIILWVIIPEAKTNSEKLRMKGKPVNVENLKDQFQKVKDNPKRKREMRRTGEFAKEVGGNFFRVFGKVMGVMLILFSVFLLIGFITFSFGGFGLFINEDGVSSISIQQFSEIIFNTSGDTTLAWIGITMVSIAPIIIMLTFGTQLLLDLKNRFSRITGFVLAGIMILGCIILSIVGTQLARDFSFGGEAEEEVVISGTHDEIYIEVMENEFFSNRIDYQNFDAMEMIQIHNDYVLLGYPELVVHNSPDTNFHVIKISSSRGMTDQNAKRRAENIEYDMDIDSNRLAFAPYFKFPKEDRFRAQDVRIIIQVPEGKKIKFGPNCNRILGSFDEERNDRANKANKTYIMDGMELHIDRN
jgi:phage shock protein PspC (stress-responsive transcriptional regulator)